MLRSRIAWYAWRIWKETTHTSTGWDWMSPKSIELMAKCHSCASCTCQGRRRKTQIINWPSASNISVRCTKKSTYMGLSTRHNWKSVSVSGVRNPLIKESRNSMIGSRSTWPFTLKLVVNPLKSNLPSVNALISKDLWKLQQSKKLSLWNTMMGI